MTRRKPWSKRSRNRKGVAVPERKSRFGPGATFDVGIALLWSVTYPSFGIAMWGLYNYFEYVHPYTHACTLILPTSSLYDVRDILVWITLPSLFVVNVLCWIGKRSIARFVLPIRCQVCPKCHADFSSRSREDDHCPKCGVIAPRRECVRLWCKLLRSRF